MRVLFIYVNIESHNIKHFPHGIGILSAVLKKHGHETDTLYINEYMHEDALLSHIGRFDPHLIAFSVVTAQWQFVQEFAAVIRTKFQAPILCGGAHPTFDPAGTINDPNVNMVCVGEGEYPLLDVLERMQNGGDLSTIPNIWVKNEAGQVFSNPVRDLIADLDTLPFTDRDILNYQDIIDKSRTEPVIMSSRGCPYNCTFCSNSAIKALYRGKGRYVRQRSPENLIAEIRAMREKYEFNTLNFYDECFGYNPSWIKRFCELYKAEFRYPFGCFIRAEASDAETFKMMADAGLSLIYIGVESGNEQLRRNVMNRKVGDERIIRACREAREAGIQVWTFNIVGIPGETVDTIDEAMNLNRIINPHFVSVSIFQPLPGTKLHQVCVDNNYIQRAYTGSFYDDSTLVLPTITRDDLLRKFREFQALSTEIRLAHEARGEKIFLADI